MADSPVTRPTPEELAQDAMDRVADWAATIPEQYALAATLLKWEGEAAAVLEQQRTTWLLGVLSTAPLQQGHPLDGMVAAA